MSSQVGSYYYTARAGEQLQVTSPIQQDQANNAKEALMQDYVSTANQQAVLGERQNKAVYFNAMADFALNKSDAVTKLNAYNKKVDLSNKLSLMKY